MWRLVTSVLVWTLTAVVAGHSNPPVITYFLAKDLVNPEEVKFRAEEGFRLPCKATGSNLKWSWKHNDTEITAFNGKPYSLMENGTLIGSHLQAANSGTYQCYVKDEKTGAVVFSRKLKVAVTVVGAFISPTNEVVKVNLGDPFTFDCPPRKHSYGVVYSWGNSDGTGHYTFARNNRRSISSNGTLFITYLTQNDIDEIDSYKGIKCIISGANSFQRSGTLRLQKIDKNQTDSENSTLPAWFVTPNERETAVEGRNKTLYCFASGRPPPTITWKKDGQKIEDNHSFKISRSFFRRLLFIQNVNKDKHEGIYTCEAANDLNTGSPLSFNVKLKVEVPPKWAPIPPPKNVSIVIDHNKTLECHVTAEPAPAVTWYKDGMQLQPSKHHILVGGKLHLTVVTLAEAGIYQCEAVNAHGMIISSTSVSVLAWKPSFANVQFGPFHLLNQKEARLPCQPSTAAPRPTFQWFKKGQLITYDGNSRYRLEEDGTLVIMEVDKDQDAVNYTCNAKNFKGEASVSTVLNILVLPVLTSTPKDQTTIEGSMITLHCNATGNPTPKITWIKDGETLATGDTLTFETLRNHSGKYWCTAENGLNVTVNASVVLDVLYESSLTTVPTEQTVTEGAIATLHCAATGNPTPTITWTKDGKTVGTGEKLSFETNRNQSGEYWCSAENGIGDAVNASANLDVQFPPTLSTKPSDRTVIENEQVTFRCVATGNPVPEITWSKNRETVATGDTLRFVADRSQSGEYWCSADNGVDEAVNTSAQLDVQFSPSLTTKPSDQSVIEKEEVTFRCTATGNPVPKITWTKDGKIVGSGNTLRFVTDRNQSGEYWCSADNGLNITANASTDLEVQYPPSLTTKPSDQTVTENDEVTFHCTAIGNPVPEISWTKDGKTVGQGNTLTFEASRDHSGEYWCSADNGLSDAVNSNADLDVQFAPSLTSRPDDITIMEGATTTFHCNATGNPTPKITWTKDGKTVATGDTLRFEANRNQSGEYWCSADNGLDTTVNASAKLDVQFPPSLIIKPSDRTVVENEEATFHCTAIGNPVPDIIWIKDGKTVGARDTLTFTALRRHSGKYWCSVDNGLGEAVNASVDLDVQFAPSLTSKPKNMTIIEGDTATFYCNATGNPAPKITWSKDGKTVATGETLSLEASRSQSGEYWCTAENGLNLTVNASANLDVQFPPSLKTKPSGQTLMENQTLALHCSAIGNPVPKITWSKDGKTVATGDTLSFDANRKDSGKYWCSADNGLGTPPNASANVKVLFPPSLITKPSDQKVIETDTVTFHCNATGNPAPKITWTKDGKTVDTGDTLNFVTERSQSGEYWCSADNGLNSTVNASATLDVQFPPSLTSKPSDQTVMEKEQVTLYCTAIGNPVPKITWSKDGKTVATGDELIIEADRDDSGKYLCLVDNGLGITVNASANLDVQFPPSLTTTPTDQTVIEGTTATLHCTATGNPTPKITWTKDGITVGSGDMLSFEANRNRSGTYWCSADNGLNPSVNESAYLDVQFPPSLTTKPSDRTVTENEEVTFHCTAIASPVPKITWIKNGMTVAKGEMLSFKANRNHSGKYWCLVENGLNITVNASADLDVQFAPSLITKPTDQTVIETATAKFYCNASGNPTPKITWTKDWQTVAKGDTLSFEANRNQSGEYWCSAENGLNSTVNASATLDVQFPPSLITKPADQTLEENQEVTFNCTATGNPTPVITWLRDGKVLARRDTLRFEADRDHSGKYWCSANNGLSEAANASAVLDVQFAPSLTSKPKDQTISEGVTATFHCNATGNPTPNITWTKDGKTVGEGDTLNFEANRDHSGEYWCTAENGLSDAVNASANLDVHFPPSFTAKPSNQTIIENQALTFHCSAIGNPVPEITWTKDGKTVGTGDTLSLEAHRNQSGKYWCSADNGMNSTINASAYLDVHYTPSLISRPDDKTILEDATVTFYCNATGNPTPKITWIKDGKTVATGEALSFATNRNQSGEYWCSADNGLNATVNASASLDVQFPPSLTSKPSNMTVIENEQLILHCFAIGNPVPKITWIKDNKTVGTGDTLSFEAHRNQSGKYWCSADNGLSEAVDASAYLDVHYAPSLTSRPDDKTILEGATVTFYCNATGNPTPKITWIKDGKTVATGEALSFATNRNQSGEYWCSADNGLNATVNASASLDVQFPPSLTSKPSNMTVIENEQLILHCSAIGNPVPKITWIKDNKTVGTGDTLSFEAHRNQSGKYWCSADNGLSEAVDASAYLDVHYAPSLTSRPDDKTILEGATVTFYCNATGNPTPKITWIKDGKTVATGEALSFATNRNQSGEYWCSADNGLNATVNASASLDVQFPPSLTAKPSNVTVIENEQLTLHCSAIGNPVPKITWIKDGKTVSSGDTMNIGVQRKHSGKYWCLADNGLGITVNASAHVDVQFPPSLLTLPTNQTILEGTDAKLLCSATGNPAPKVVWLKDGRAVAIGEELSFEANRNQSGTYWCSADNGLSASVNASAKLDVQFPPSLVIKPSDETVIENEEIRFHCSATGNPVPRITWIKDGKTVGSGETLSLESKRNDSGKYWCSADNGLSEAVNASAYLDVQFPPSLLTNPTDQIVLEGANVTFHCSATGNPTPDMNWTKDGKTVAKGDTLSFEASREDAGKYWCSIDNGLSDAVNASAVLDVQFPPSLTSKPSKQTVTENEEVTFHCSAIGNPVPKITWSKDGKTVGTGDTLSFEAFRNQSGEYWCSADNGLDKTVNASASLVVEFPPSLTTKPTDQTILEAAVATFHCAATGNPNPKIIWTKDGKTVGTGETLSFEAFRNHSGEYWCLADNELNSTVNASAYLDVQYLPSFTTVPTDQTVTEAAMATFHCEATGNPTPEITWTKNGKTVGEGNKLSFEANKNQSGEYWCSAENGLEAKINTSASLDVQYAPSLTTRPNNQTIIEADNATFTCVATGNPTPKITWIKDGMVVGKGETLSFEAFRNQSGKYWCLANNGLNPVVNTSAYLNVQFLPSLLTKAVNQTVNETDDVTLHCAATGNPVPNITWFKDGKPVGTGSKLSFEALRSHSGKYWCLANNGLNATVNSIAYLNVHYPPSFTKKPIDQIVTETDEAIFHCTAIGNPEPEIKWMKDGKTVSEGNTLNLKATRNQTGEYWCWADNGIGKAVKTGVHLDVQFPPSLTTTPDDHTLSEKATAIFHCTAIGNPVPEITWIKDGMTVGNGNTLRFEAQKDHSGTYWCTANNGFNTTANASAYLDVLYPPSLTTEPTDQTVIEATAATFHCNATGNPVPKITWTKDGKTVATGDTLSFVTDRNQSGEYWCSANNGMNSTVNANATLEVQFSPSLTTKPINETVLEMDIATFFCSATGNPTPKITWIKDEETVGTGDIMSFMASRNHSGEYWCSADNGLSEAVTGSAYLDVQFPPCFTEMPINQTVNEGDKATFRCSAIGNPVPQMKWMKDGKTVATGDTLSFEANRNQSGEYWCSADNGLGLAINSSAYLDVQFAPALTKIPAAQTITEGDVAIFHCTASGNPTPEIKWMRDDTIVDTGETLTFDALRDDSGEYWCVAENGFGTTANASAYLDVQFPPSFTSTPSDQIVNEKDQTTFTCIATGNPVPNITWSKDGKTVGTGDTLSFEASRNRSGIYWCSAENGIDESINTSVSLDVQFSPSLAMQPTNQTVSEGATATFYCNATGNPPPKIRWIKDGKTVGEENTLSFVTNRNQSGKYWCRAENGFDATVKAIAYLNVQFPPSFTSTPINQTVTEDYDVTFHCTATGNPTPKITWQREGKTIATGNMLKLMAANRNESGTYWCSAKNGLGLKINSSVHLDVQFPPRLTTRPTNQTIIETATVTFHCAATGNPAPKITWSKDGKPVGIGEKLTVEAFRNHSGEYWCSAHNGLQPTANASAVLDVQFPPIFTTRPTDQTIKEGDKIAFHCTAIGNPIPKITWSKDGKTVATGQTLSFEANRNQSGEYWCSAGNGIDENATSSVSLDVQFPPSLSTTPADQTVIEGTMATLHCVATGNPTPKITWTKDGKTVGRGETLRFEASRDQSGKYWCSAENGLNSTFNASAHIDVQFPPHFTTRPMDQTVEESEAATFHCTATGNPVPTIKWIKDGMTVGVGKTLSFEASRNQSGKYLCSADNGLGTSINASATLGVQFVPSWIKRPTDQTVSEGATATFHCAATGNPTPEITWTKDGKTVGTGNTLSFQASRGQSGKYWCSVENGLKTPINASAYLDVMYPTSLTSTPTDQTVKEGDETTLYCAAAGNPVPNITWIKDGKTVATGNELRFQANRNQSGKYWCSANNGLGLTVNASAYLNVQFPPHVTVKSSYQTVIEGTVATLHCSATGNPTPNITWMKGGKTVGTGHKLSFKAFRSQSGKYWCSAENGFNKTAKATCYLDVHFKPEKTRLTVNTDIAKAVQAGSTIKFNCTTFSHPDADGYKFYRDQELLGSNSTGVYQLLLQRSGVYSCVPFNSAGKGLRAVLRIEVIAWKPSFNRVTFGPFYLFKGSQARLPCKPFAEPYPTFKWFKDGAAISSGKNQSYRVDADGSLVIIKVKDGDSGKYTCMAQNYLGKTNATADGILLERTEIIAKPQNRTVIVGTSVDLRCKATADPLLELRYIWKRDGADVTDESNIQWLEDGNVLKLANIRFEEAGVYTCVAYTPEPRGSEDSASAIVSVTGVPSPPSNLQLTDCYHRHTNLSWTPGSSNSSHIKHYLIEQETNHHPSVFKLIYNVTSPDVTSVSLTLPGWSTLRFRVRAVNTVGPSRPSVATAGEICTTPVEIPQKYPSNLRGVPTKANQLSISWTPMTETEWNAPGFYYVLQYRKVNLGYLSEWKEEKIGDPGVHVFAVTNAGYYQLWEFKIRTGNHEGFGPESPVRRSFSGQDAPAAKPETAEVEAVTSSSVALAWKPVTVLKGSIDGYKIYYWGQSRSVSSRRRRQAIPTTADFITVLGGKTQQATLSGLKPYTNYQVVVKAFNSGGEGPPSAVIVFETLEGEPGPPSNVQVYPFGEFILVTWKPPKEPNGIITNYQVGSAEYNGSSPENVPVAMETVGPNVFKQLLGNETSEKRYVVKVRAQTSKGWGASASETTRTLKRLAPAKPDKPKVVGTGEAAVSVMYKFGVGGGWTHEFKVLYRKKEEGGEFQATDWVNHFSTQWTDINSLEQEVYEFKTVGRNTVGRSAESDVTEARPKQGSVVSGQRGSASVYQSDWFITLIILSACTLLLLIIIITYRRWRRSRSSNFNVSEHEKEMKKEQTEQGVPVDIAVDIKRREDWKKTLNDRLEEASQDSLDEYGGDGAYFAEDGSFVGDLKQGRNRESVYEEIPDPEV